MAKRPDASQVDWFTLVNSAANWMITIHNAHTLADHQANNSISLMEYICLKKGTILVRLKRTEHKIEKRRERKKRQRQHKQYRWWRVKRNKKKRTNNNNKWRENTTDKAKVGKKPIKRLLRIVVSYFMFIRLLCSLCCLFAQRLQFTHSFTHSISFLHSTPLIRQRYPI